MSQLQQNPPTPDMNEAPDPLRSLHKMSTTAGVSSSDYVAINTAAVWAAVLGFGSFFALFETVLGIVPVVAMIFGIVALRQISRSGGTESGRLWAYIGIGLALATLGGRAFYQLTEHRRNSI